MPDNMPESDKQTNNNIQPENNNQTNNNNQSNNSPKDNWFLSLIETVVVFSRWLLAPFILGLVLVTAYLGCAFLLDVVRLPGHVDWPDGRDIIVAIPTMLDQLWPDDKHLTVSILALLDKFMVGLVLITTLMGTYVIFIRPFNPDRKFNGSFLEGITIKHLEIAMYLCLGGVTAIGLLQDLNNKELSWYGLSQHLAIHFTVILSAMAISLIVRWMH